MNSNCIYSFIHQFCTDASIFVHLLKHAVCTNNKCMWTFIHMQMVQKHLKSSWCNPRISSTGLKIKVVSPICEPKFFARKKLNCLTISFKNKRLLFLELSLNNLKFFAKNCFTNLRNFLRKNFELFYENS